MQRRIKIAALAVTGGAAALVLAGTLAWRVATRAASPLPARSTPTV
jgi:hypothetical protein